MFVGRGFAGWRQVTALRRRCSPAAINVTETPACWGFNKGFWRATSYSYSQDEPIMSVAGIWEPWHAGKPDERRSFSILTTAANDFMREIHDCMPVILGRSAEG